MPLTPADVHNVAFSKPPIGKRGYNEDEVDAFLDLVENELTRLIEENSDLRQRINELDQELAAGGGAGVTPQATQAIPAYEPEPGKPAPAAVSAGMNEEQALKAARVLSLAQDTADRLTNTAKAESDKMLADARANAEQILGEARHTADATVAEARQRADAMLADAQSRSEAQLRQAQEKADALQADAERKHSEIMEPSTSSARCLKAASSSCVPSNVSTAPGSRPTWNRSWRNSASVDRRRRSIPMRMPVASINSTGAKTSHQACRTRASFRGRQPDPGRLGSRC